MAKKVETSIELPTKYERTFEDDYVVETWKYDMDKTKFGPFEVSVHYKPLWTKERKEELAAKKLEKRKEKMNKKAV